MVANKPEAFADVKLQSPIPPNELTRREGTTGTVCRITNRKIELPVDDVQMAMLRTRVVSLELRPPCSNTLRIPEGKSLVVRHRFSASKDRTLP